MTEPKVLPHNAMKNDLEDRKKIARYIISNAGSLITDLFHKKIQANFKSANDYVTELDKSIESMALKTIIEAFPDDGFYGEEGTGKASTNGYMWVCDPIDGTNNFVRGLPLCGVQIALLYNSEPFFSIILRPLTQETFFAAKGEGAFYHNLLTGEETQIKVSDRSLHDALAIFDANVGKSTDPSTHILTILADKIATVRVLGVAVFDIPSIAAGIGEILVTGIAKRYDVAPGILLLKEAGGEVYNLEGAEPGIDDELMIFSNKVIKEQLLALIGMRT